MNLEHVRTSFALSTTFLLLHFGQKTSPVNSTTLFLNLFLDNNQPRGTVLVVMVAFVFSTFVINVVAIVLISTQLVPIQVRILCKKNFFPLKLKHFEDKNEFLFCSKPNGSRICLEKRSNGLYCLENTD